MGAILGIVPKYIRPLIGSIIALPCRFYQRKINCALKPLFTERMRFLQNLPENDTTEPQDHFQMMLRFAQKERPHELNLHDIGTRIVIANLGSFHQTGIATTNLILNIIESNAEYNTISILRDEISNVLLGSGGVWSRAAVAKMVRADSVLRETLRINSFSARNMLRKVMISNLHTKDGIVLPKGCDVTMLTFSIQTDSDLFEDPFKFDPFRYSRMRENVPSTTDDHGNQGNGPTANLNFVSTGPQFLPFGHGKHACPGRYLVDFELKMILAYVLLNYDLEFPDEYKGRRPEVTWMAEVLMPPTAAKIRVRRRED